MSGSHRLEGLMAPDIEARIATDFRADERGEVRATLDLLDSELGNDSHPRILRCVLFLAQGDATRLIQMADRTRMDWRDVIYWAEYEEHDFRMRDFNEPFTER
jgi:hypothetical protein